MQNHEIILIDMEPHPGIKDPRKAHRTKRCFAGEKVGRWEVLLRAPDNANQQIVYWCRCECGFLARVEKRSLASGRSKSCGCLKSELGSKWLKNRWANGLHKNGRLISI